MAIPDEPVEAAVARLRAQGADDGDYEAKACASRLSASVWDSVSAFANTSGGTLLLGLDENAGFAVPDGFDWARVRDQLVEGMGDGGGTGARLTLPPEYRVERAMVDGNPILVVRVLENPADKKPCFVTAKGVEGGSYKRVGDKDIRLSAAEVYELRNLLRPSLADMAVVAEADRSDLDGDVLTGILDRRRGSKALRGVDGQAERLARLNITDKTGGVRMAGLLVAGVYPQQFFPRLLVDVAVHPGTRKSEPGMPRFLDRVLCDGPMAEMIDDAVNAVARNLRTVSVVEGAGRRDEPEIPLEVLREAIANAVIHREYHPYFQGQSVGVDVYADRVEVSSPGGLWGGKTLENIANGESRCRNTALIQLMQTTPSAGGMATVEGQGTGVMFMTSQMQDKGLPLPEFRPAPDRFTVIFRRRPIRTPETNATDRTERPVGPISASDMLSLIPTDGAIGTRELAALTGKSQETVRRMLRDWLARGLVVAVGKPHSRQRRYMRITATDERISS